MGGILIKNCVRFVIITGIIILVRITLNYAVILNLPMMNADVLVYLQLVGLSLYENMIRNRMILLSKVIMGLYSSFNLYINV